MKLFHRAAPGRDDQVTVRFAGGEGEPFSVELLNRDGSTRAAGPLALMARWLQVHGFRYATGSSGQWVRP